MTQSATSPSATACTTRDGAGKVSKPWVSTIANWNPNSACAPGRMTRASVSICSILTCSGVDDPLDADENVDAERQCERKQRQIGNDRRHLVEGAAVPAAFDDAMVGTG